MCWGKTDDEETRRPRERPPQDAVEMQPRVWQRPVAMAQSAMDTDTVEQVLLDLRRTMGENTYALVGGLGCVTLGSTRGTNDVDIIVPDGSSNAAMELLCQNRRFRSDGHGIWYHAQNRQDYNVDILTPGKLELEFGLEGNRIKQGSTAVLRPDMILNLKCYAWASHNRRAMKRQNDARDIRFLLEYMHRNSFPVDHRRVEFATRDFITEFTAIYGQTTVLWRDLGFRI